ncbi:MAG: surface-adhesin E family protein [Caulobacterales bacterium]
MALRSAARRTLMAGALAAAAWALAAPSCQAGTFYVLEGDREKVSFIDRDSLVVSKQFRAAWITTIYAKDQVTPGIPMPYRVAMFHFVIDCALRREQSLGGLVYDEDRKTIHALGVGSAWRDIVAKSNGDMMQSYSCGRSAWRGVPISGDIPDLERRFAALLAAGSL